MISNKVIALDRLLTFKDNCENYTLNQFVDVFLPMLYQENNARLEISVGKIISSSEFQSYLSLVTHKFNVGVQLYNNELQLILSNLNERHMIALFNLTEIKNLCINVRQAIDCRHPDWRSDWFKYDISFNYNNQNDYKIYIEK